MDHVEITPEKQDLEHALHEQGVTLGTVLYRSLTADQMRAMLAILERDGE